MVKINVNTPSGVQVLEAEQGQTVLSVLQNAGIVVDAPCGGRGTCKKCRVLISDESGASYRLACLTTIHDTMDVTLEDSGEIAVSMGSSLEDWLADGDPDTYGFAIDVGTTTIACRLQDLHTGEVLGVMGCSNPQLAFGADVLSRISASDERGIASMKELLGDALVDLAERLLKKNGIPKEKVVFSVLAANTTMEHLAMGYDPTSIGVSPFKPYTLFGDTLIYEPFEKAGIAGGKMLFAPCVAAYVGGDITAGILAVLMLFQKQPMFLLDLGTNGEMALGSYKGIVTCATAAGPVFEGANIKYGMPAYPGAISRVAAGDVPGTLQLGVLGDREPVGVCGTGLFDALALMLDHGLVDETGRMLLPSEIDTSVSFGLEQRIAEEDGQPVFMLNDRLCITQKDVRSIQLAKASICAGMLTLMHDQGIEMDEIGSLLIAGGFGQYLDLRSAARVGVFPMELLDRAQSVGNTSVDGASALLISRDANGELASIMEATSYIELSTSPTFNELYIEQMEFEVDD